MNKFFKMSLVAAAVAVSGSAVAGELTVTAAKYSAEGLAVANAATPNNNVSTAGGTYAVKTAYPLGSKVVLTFSPGSIAAGYVFPATQATDGGTVAGQVTLASPVRLSNDSVEYTVTNGTDAVGLVIDDEITLAFAAGGGVEALLGTAVVAAPVSLTVTAKYASGAALDTVGTNVKPLTTVASQFGELETASPKLNAQIDVSEARKAFTDSELSDVATFNFDSYTASIAGMVPASVSAPSKVSVTIDADLTGFEVDKDDVITGAAVAVTGTVNQSNVSDLVYDADKKQLSFDVDNVADAAALTGYTLTITPPVTSASAETTAVELMPQSFSSAVSYTYAVTKTASIGSASAGSWTLNGSSGTIEYMPFGNTISQIIYVTNKGTVEGAITGDAIVNGEKIDLGDLGTATAKSVTPIAGKIKAALEDAGITGSAKARLNIVINSPSSDIKIYASYNVGGSDRGFVPVTHTN